MVHHNTHSQFHHSPFYTHQQASKCLPECWLFVRPLAKHITQYPCETIIISISQLRKLRLRDFKWLFNYRLKPVLGWCPPEVDPKIKVQVPVEGNRKVNREGKAANEGSQLLLWTAGIRSRQATLRDSREHAPKQPQQRRGSWRTYAPSPSSHWLRPKEHGKDADIAQFHAARKMAEYKFNTVFITCKEMSS